MSPIRSVAAAALALAVAVVAPARATAQGTLTFPASYSNPVAGGYSVGPFAGATFTPTGGSPTSLTVFCDDLLNHVSAGETFSVNVSSLGYGAGSLGETRHPGQLAAYRQVAWLTSLYGYAGAQAYWGSIQFAIWNVFSPAQAPADVYTPYLATLASTAASNNYQAFDAYGIHFDAVDMNQYHVLTDVAAAGVASGAGAQEFLTRDLTATATPEPATFALVGLGLVATGAVVRRRRTA